MGVSISGSARSLLQVVVLETLETLRNKRIPYSYYSSSLFFFPWWSFLIILMLGLRRSPVKSMSNLETPPAGGFVGRLDGAHSISYFFLTMKSNMLSLRFLRWNTLSLCSISWYAFVAITWQLVRKGFHLILLYRSRQNQPQHPTLFHYLLISRQNLGFFFLLRSDFTYDCRQFEVCFLVVSHFNFPFDSSSFSSLHRTCGLAFVEKVGSGNFLKDYWNHSFTEFFFYQSWKKFPWGQIRKSYIRTLTNRLSAMSERKCQKC